MKKDSARKFDMVSAVFIDGDYNILPWDKKMRKVNSLVFIIYSLKIIIFLRMCLRTNKTIIASGFAM